MDGLSLASGKYRRPARRIACKRLVVGAATLSLAWVLSAGFAVAQYHPYGSAVSLDHRGPVSLSARPVAVRLPPVTWQRLAYPQTMRSQPGLPFQQFAGTVTQPAYVTSYGVPSPPFVPGSQPWQVPAGQNLYLVNLQSQPPASEAPTTIAQPSTAAATPRPAPLPLPTRPSGYIESAVIGNVLRIRGDSIGPVPSPARAEYLFPAPSIVGGPAGGGIVPPPPMPPVEYDEIRAYLELAPTDRFSIFTEFTARSINHGPALEPVGGGFTFQHFGVGDISAGMRIGLFRSEEAMLTGQFRAILPSGDPTRCLGTGHASVEVGLLYQNQVSDRLVLFSEMVDWQAIASTRVVDFFGGLNSQFEGERFGGNVLRSGIGAGYDFWVGDHTSLFPRVTAVTEFVSWSVLDGLKLQGIGPVQDATGDTIVNLKLGIRAALRNGSSFYVGYGFPLTNDLVYEDILRLEYNLPLGR